ncbi:hypothetical protein GDO78_005390 [Eleutherodactylus coqui]|uniref:Protein PIGBOS1 n=2 Tax=Eleutherodactylus coqui TaxID=57060 RepID=A0A8J6FL89_ELECQ|nr:hypothetical protein GDO78_005390 [Eleutherodactylus coqui]KAG9489376.1 hypothetical protein GDO78_005390 [Eleutherodactylus coqui]
MIRRLTYGQLFLGMLLGFAGGVYIYKPMFEKYLSQRKALDSDVPTADAGKQEN